MAKTVSAGRERVEELFAKRYRILGLLGRGAMSEVWSAEDLELDRTVALKLLSPSADAARFEREARAVASLSHPNVTAIFDYGECDGRPFIVLEHLPGGTLESVLRDGAPLADAETSRLAAEIASGLAHAHSRGVVHRDLKPSNILLDEAGHAKLADFGIARLAAGDGTLTEAGTVLGTAAYISPEQVDGQPATAASDVYSFGVILYRLLTGHLPFESADPLALLVAHSSEPPPTLTRYRDDIPPVLGATAIAALVKDPAARPADGEALVAALAGPVLEPTVAATSVALPTRTPPAPVARRRRGRGMLIAAILLLLAFTGVALAYLVSRPGDGSATILSKPTAGNAIERPRPKKHPAAILSSPAPTTGTGPAATSTTKQHRRHAQRLHAVKPAKAHASRQTTTGTSSARLTTHQATTSPAAGPTTTARTTTRLSTRPTATPATTRSPTTPPTSTRAPSTVPAPTTAPAGTAATTTAPATTAPTTTSPAATTPPTTTTTPSTTTASTTAPSTTAPSTTAPSTTTATSSTTTTTTASTSTTTTTGSTSTTARTTTTGAAGSTTTADTTSTAATTTP